MRFVDYAKIFVNSGKGGRGSVSFRREKYVPRGGPDGGDGGKGGDVIIKSTSNMNTLLDFRYKREYIARDGQNGMKQKMHGKDGEDMIIPVPVGTLLRLADTGEIIADLVNDNDSFTPAKGGRGGQGNSHFATATRQSPKFAQPGEDGEEKWIILELKLIADVGLIGLPNAGKSTLISVISSAKPKIADYPFTTLSPNLGVVKVSNYKSFVVADIPGLIEGAHKGAGLGHQFLRHVERTSILLHLVDVSETTDGDPVEDLKKINKELGLYSEKLMNKHQTVVGTKTDISGNGTRLKTLEKFCKDNSIEFFPISAVTGKGIKKLLPYLAHKIG